MWHGFGGNATRSIDPSTVRSLHSAPVILSQLRGILHSAAHDSSAGGTFAARRQPRSDSTPGPRQQQQHILMTLRSNRVVYATTPSSANGVVWFSAALIDGHNGAISARGRPISPYDHYPVRDPLVCLCFALRIFDRGYGRNSRSFYNCGL